MSFHQNHHHHNHQHDDHYQHHHHQQCPEPPTCCESGYYAFDECGCCLKCAKVYLLSSTSSTLDKSLVSDVQRFINYYHHPHHLLIQMCKGSSIINVIITIIIIMSKSGRATDLWRSFCYFWKMCRWTPMPKNMP